MTEKPIVKVLKDGPYVIQHLLQLTNSQGQPLETKPVMALCRCGHSSTKPFCDGTHGKIGFQGGKLPGAIPPERHEFKGTTITISDNEGVCSHAGFCDGNLPDVFWTFENGHRVAHPDAAPAEKSITTIKLCPSGALRFKIKEKMYDDFGREPGIKVSKDGPYYVVGGVELNDDIQSHPDSLEHYTLCRCGASKNKPFCDGSHGKIKFKDEKN